MYQSRANAYKTVGVQSASPERILDEDQTMNVKLACLKVNI